MSREYRLYRQDVITEMEDGSLVYDSSWIEGDLPSGGDDVTLVELDGTERPMEASFELLLKPKPEPT